jgi:hypothetical protein
MSNCWSDFNRTSQKLSIAGIFSSTAQNGRQSNKKKNLVQLSEVKLLAGFQ